MVSNILCFPSEIGFVYLYNEAGDLLFVAFEKTTPGCA